jgi:hypothetical protein
LEPLAFKANEDSVRRRIGTFPDRKEEEGDDGFAEKDWKTCGGRSPHEEFYDEMMKVTKKGQIKKGNR